MRLSPINQSGQRGWVVNFHPPQAQFVHLRNVGLLDAVGCQLVLPSGEQVYNLCISFIPFTWLQGPLQNEDLNGTPIQ